MLSMNDALSIVSWDFNYVRRSIDTEKSFSLNTRWKLPFQKERPYSVVVLIVSMSNYTELTPHDDRYYDFSKKFRKTEPCEKLDRVP